MAHISSPQEINKEHVKQMLNRDRRGVVVELVLVKTKLKREVRFYEYSLRVDYGSYIFAREFVSNEVLAVCPEGSKVILHWN
jgi:hypothetical protein